MSETAPEGILAAGNFIIDHVKIVDEYPAPEMLASILTQSRSNGGGPYNLLQDLARMEAPFPLAALGLVGQDPEGDWIAGDCRRSGIDTTRLQRTAEAATSYTDAMTVQRGGQRTFFHHRGANALLADRHFEFTACTARLFYLGYLLLLDTLDTLDTEERTGASRVLERASAHGLLTCADLVSVNHPRCAAIVRASLPFVDYLFINEIEAGMVLGRDLRSSGAFDPGPCLDAADALLQLGVRRTVILHCGEGAVAADAAEGSFRQGRVRLPPERIRGATGAGDAFAAGYLFATHQALSIPERLRLAVCAAAACLERETPSDGLRPAPECLALGEAHGFVAM